MPKISDTLPRPHPQRKPLRIFTDVPLLTSRSLEFSSDSSSSAGQSVSTVTTLSAEGLQYLCYAICMHNFESSDPVHLPFNRNEVLIIIKQEHSGWWAAMRPQGDRIGWIPSSFVLPLRDSCKIVEYPDETPWLVESLNDHPLSAVCDPWVPVSEEDSKVLAFQPVTQTDLDLYKHNSVRNHDDESLLCPSDDEGDHSGSL